MTKLWLLLKRDFISSSHIKNTIFNSIALLISNLISLFSVKDNLVNEIFVNLYLSSLFIVLLISLEKIFKEDIKDGTIDLMQSYKISLRELCLIKIINFILIVFLPVIIIETGIFVVLGFSNYDFLCRMALMILASSLGISAISVLISLILSKKDSIGVVMVVYAPLIITPLLLIVVGMQSNFGLLGLIGFSSIIFSSVMLFLGKT